MTAPRLLLGHTSPDAPAHAVPEGSTTALCGTTGTITTMLLFPGGASSVCRACAREAAAGSSTVPLRGLGGRKRPGGM